jgi:hypothetical protein
MPVPKASKASGHLSILLCVIRCSAVPGDIFDAEIRYTNRGHQ